jgi:hypothetical protein
MVIDRPEPSKNTYLISALDDFARRICFGNYLFSPIVSARIFVVKRWMSADSTNGAGTN